MNYCARRPFCVPAWETFDAAASAASGSELRKGPRGGGRDLEKIFEHVQMAEVAYLGRLGGKLESALWHGRRTDDACNPECHPADVGTRRARRSCRPPAHAAVSTGRCVISSAAAPGIYSTHAWEIEDRRL